MLNQEEQKVLEFLKAWINWVDAGAKKHLLFTTSWGLCHLSYRYNPSNAEALHAMFALDGLDAAFPFSPAEQTRHDKSKFYFAEESMEVMHRNPRRLAWVRKTITSLESQADAWEVDQLNSPM